MNNLGSTSEHNALYQVFRPWILVLEKIFQVFTIYGRGGEVGHVSQTILTSFRS